MFVAGAVTVGRAVPDVQFADRSTLCYRVHDGLVLESVQSGQQVRYRVYVLCIGIPRGWRTFR